MKHCCKLPKQSRIKSKKDIETLFQNGEAFFVHPIKALYQIQPSNTTSPKGLVQIAVSAPKKKFRTAVQRNFIKRRLREAFRLQQSDVLSACAVQNKNLKVILIYAATTVEDYKIVYNAMGKIINRLGTIVITDNCINDSYKH